MKIRIMIFTLTLLAFSVASASAQAELPGALAYYDAQIDVLLPYLDQYQADYHAANGQYYQALASHASAPDVPTPPDGLSSAPTDQSANLAYFWQSAALPEALAWSFKIDTYSGEYGDGYVLTVAADIDGEIWNRLINYGPDTWRASEWYQVVPFNF